MIMIKLIKHSKKTFLHMEGLKQRSEYLKVINDSVESLSMEFHFLNYSLIISGWSLMIPVVISLYLAIAIYMGIGIDTGVISSFIIIILMVGAILGLFKIIPEIAGMILKHAFNM